MNIDRERVISISLTEAEWQAFIARRPKPVDWLRARILDEVAQVRREDAAQTDFTRKS
jgi:hypothetical protein